LRVCDARNGRGNDRTGREESARNIDR